MTNFEWRKLKKDFEEGRCVIMIGPHLAGLQRDGGEVPLVEELSLHLAEVLDEEKIKYDKKAVRSLSYIALRFLSIEGARRVDLEDMAKDFILDNTKTVPEVYKSLAQLPAQLIVNTNPDNFIERALREQGKQAMSYFYNFRREQELQIDIDKLSIERPLVYNLFGSLDKQESLVLTEEDQVDFIRNVVKEVPRIPTEIMSQFDDRKTYLFFGFNLENWQFRLLLDGLQLKEGNTTWSPQESRFPLSSMTKAFYKERFSFKFIDQDIDQFLALLLKKVGGDTSEKEREQKRLFILSHPDDETYRVELEKALSPLQDNGDIELQYREKFIGGTDDSEIWEAYDSAHIVLPILSPNFLADDNLIKAWLPRAAKRCDGESAFLRPVLARLCDWRENEHLRTREPLPEEGEPIASKFWSSHDDAYFSIVQAIKKML